MESQQEQQQTHRINRWRVQLASRPTSQKFRYLSTSFMVLNGIDSHITLIHVILNAVYTYNTYEEQGTVPGWGRLLLYMLICMSVVALGWLAIFSLNPTFMYLYMVFGLKIIIWSALSPVVDAMMIITIVVGTIGVILMMCVLLEIKNEERRVQHQRAAQSVGMNELVVT